MSRAAESSDAARSRILLGPGDRPRPYVLPDVRLHPCRPGPHSLSFFIWSFFQRELPLTGIPAAITSAPSAVVGIHHGSGVTGRAAVV